MRCKVGIVVLLSALGVGCRSEKLSSELTIPRKQDLAAEAVVKLRDAYNADCHSIFWESDDILRLSGRYAGQSWIAECAQLQSTLGRWLRFDIETNHGQALGVYMTGSAKFGSGVQGIQMFWGFSADTSRRHPQPYLVWLNTVRHDGTIRHFPPRLQSAPQLIHPPDKRPVLSDPPPGSRRTAA